MRLAMLAYLGFTLIQDIRSTVPSSVVLHALLGFTYVATLQPSTLSTGVTTTLSLFQPDYPYDALNAIWGACAFGVLVGVWLLDIPRALAKARPDRAPIVEPLAMRAVAVVG